ncbi:MAG: sulfatase [Phycisphaerales bacterium]
MVVDVCARRALFVRRRGWGRLMRAVVASAGAALASTGFAQDRPNLIFFVTDDQGVDAIEGDPWPNRLEVHTPTMDDLASEGVAFTNLRVTPYCSPTRAGLLTGRHAFETGVNGVVNETRPRPDRDLVSLQTQERTIAEALQAAGYYTILVDKWHVGYDGDRGQLPSQQGFDEFHPYQQYVRYDDPLELGDEHITRMIDIAIDAVETRPNRDQPYALFFWSIDPHSRIDMSGREPFLWWKVDESLLPSGENYYAPWRDSNRHRYRAVVESIDTELRRLLRSLEVMESDGEYNGDSDTVVIFTSDNGVPQEVAIRADRAKGTIYEGGSRVPLIIYGERVPEGRVEDRLVSYVDFYDTIADIAGVPSESRGDAPRWSYSFADSINWSNDPLPERSYAVSTLGHPNEPASHRVSITDGRWKLIMPGGGAGLTPFGRDELYDLDDDPDEDRNLMVGGLSDPEASVYRVLRTALRHEWPVATGVPSSRNIDIGVTHTMALDSDDDQRPFFLEVGHDTSGRALETRTFLRFDIDAIEPQFPAWADWDDIVAAEIFIVFRFDSTESDETDIGPVRAFAMTRDWTGGRPRWSRLRNEYDGSVELGLVDFAPHIIPDPVGDALRGSPLTYGAALSLGPSEELADKLRWWRDHPDENHGVVLIADKLGELSGDQHVSLVKIAGVRITLRED